MDPEIYDSFRSHCLQEYPEYEIIFGVSDPARSSHRQRGLAAPGLSRSQHSASRV